MAHEIIPRKLDALNPGSEKNGRFCGRVTALLCPEVLKNAAIG